MHQIENIFKFLPTQCLRCRCMQVSPIRNICSPCYAEIPRIQSGCKRCGIPTLLPVSACGQCLNSKRHVEQSFIPCSYRSPVDVWLRELKDRRDFETLPVLSQLLYDSLKEGRNRRPDIILPIPIHRSRRIIRGYNQTELLADMLSELMEIPVNHKILLRSRSVTSQRKLSRSARIRNQKNSFCLKNIDCIQGKRILLVDDIVTTGSTVTQAAEALRDGGAKSIVLTAVARTPELTSR